MSLYKSGDMTVPGAIDAYVVKINEQSWVGQYNGEMSYTLAGNPAHAMVFNEAKHAYNVAKQYGGTAIRLALDQVVTEADTYDTDSGRYGWEAEPEAKLYVQTPKEWWEDSAIPEWMHFDTCRGVCSGFSKLGRTAFTRAELKQYNLDSDIFTLVPVEADKEVS